MPLYVYSCDKCSHQFERLMRLSDPNPTCPNEEEGGSEGEGQPKTCGGPTTKIITGGNFHLKGSGWASDGYS